MYLGLHAKFPDILVHFELIFNFLNRFAKNNLISNIVKIRVVGSEMLHADRQTDGWMVRQTGFLTRLKRATITEDLDVIPIKNACARGIPSELNLAVAMLYRY